MVDPKRTLTPLHEEHRLNLAAAAPVADVVDRLASCSITTVEEVLALARVAGDLLALVGVEPAVVDRMLEQYRASPTGGAQVASWDEYETREYTTGYEFAGATPPAVHGHRPDAAATPVSLLDERMPPIRDQAQRGTCTAFAAVTCVEYQEHGVNEATVADLSEQFAYWNMVEGAPHHDLLSMFMALRNDGTCDEHTWPYVPTEVSGDDGQGPPPPGATVEARGHRPGTVRQLPPRAVEQIRAAIAAQRPVAIGIPVYASWFESPVVRRYGNLTVPLPGEAPEPIGHAVALVGFADDVQFAGGGYFIVRNSWGTRWATGSEFGPGYGTIPYRYVEGYNWDAWCVS